jgi:hypothetical protein
MTAQLNCKAAIAKFLFATSLICALAACAALPANGADSWKEEVLLHDGQKIIVERSQTYKGRSEPGQPAPIGEHTIRFSLPGSGKAINWTSEYGADIGRTDFNLSALHVKNGTPYVIAEPNLCLSYNKWGRPNPPYVVFRYDGNAWQRVTFEALPAEFTTVNVVKRIRGIDVENLVKARQVNAEQVAALNAGLERPEAKAILRERINYDPECIPMTSNGKGRWRSTAWFETKSNLDSCRFACRQDDYDDKHCPCNQIFLRK